MSNVLEVILNLVDNLSPGLDAASGSVENLENAVNTASNSIDNIDATSFADVEAGALAAGLDLNTVGEAAASAGLDINNINPSTLQVTAEEAQNASSSLNEAANSSFNMEDAMKGLVGIGVVAWFDNIINAAGNFADSWSRIDIATDGVMNGIEATEEQWNSSVNTMRDNTGRKAGDIRTFINLMGVAGVTNADLISSAFTGLSASAFKSPIYSLQQMETSFQRVVQTGTGFQRVMLQMGVNSDTVLKATGKSVQELNTDFKNMSSEQRAAVLSSILNMNGAEAANEAYKNSWEHVTDAIGAAYDYLSRIIGSLVVPILVPVLEVVTNLLSGLASAIDGMNPTLKGIMGGVTLFVGGLTTLFLMLGPIIKLLGPLFAPILKSLGVAFLEAGGSAALFETLLGPVGWAILAITAAVAAAIFIWQNWSKEIINFKNAIMSGDWGSAASQIGDSFNYIGDAIYSALVNAGQQIWTFFAQLPAWIGENYTAWLNMGRDMLLWIVQGLTSLSSYLSTTLTEMMTAMATDGSSQAAGTTAGQSTGKGIIDGLKQWLIDNGPLIGQTLVLIFQQLLPLIGAIFLQMGAIVAVWVYQEAIKAGQRFINGFLQMLAQLPGLVLVGLIQTVLTIAMWGYQVWNYALWAGSMLVQGFVSWLSQLPGIAWMYFLAFLNYLGQLPGIAYGYAASTGNAIVSAIGSYLSSLPGQMYSWGMNALGRFVDGIINSIPGLSAALATVRSLFPASPPKKGPLSEIKGDNMEAWMRGIMDAGSGVWDDFTIGDNILGSRGSVSTGNGGGNTLNLNVTVDGSDSKSNKEIARDVEQTILSSKMIKQIDIGLGKLQGDVNRSRGI